MVLHKFILFIVFVFSNFVFFLVLSFVLLFFSCLVEYERTQNDPIVNAKKEELKTAVDVPDLETLAADIENTLEIPIAQPEIGRVVAVLGAVVDIQFPTEDCPDENDAIEVIIRYVLNINLIWFLNFAYFQIYHFGKKNSLLFIYIYLCFCLCL